MAEPGWKSNEKSFYLAEFRGRSLALSLPFEDRVDLEPIRGVLDDLSANGTRVVLLSPYASLLDGLSRCPTMRCEGERWPGRLWRMFQRDPVVGLQLLPRRFAEQVGAAMLAIRPAKLVWLIRPPALRRPDGSRISVLSRGDLDTGPLELSDDPDSPLLEHPDLLAQVQRMLESGLPAVNLCCADGLPDELFTYAGSGTFITRDRYAEVRRLSLDDFDLAADLMARGVEEGYLAPRDPAEVECVLSRGFGVFIEGRYLAGIGSLIVHGDDRAQEFVSLYTLTRYLGEGVGSHLVRHGIEAAAGEGCAYVFACTTSEQVQRFFERHGFREVPHHQVPASKWARYDAARKARVRCVRLDLPPEVLLR